MKQKILVLVVILFAVLATAIPALAAAPAEGTVYEGVRVPGIALGDSRTEVEASYGPPISCVNYNEPNDMAACKFDVEGGGTVTVQYRGPNGGSPSGSPDDVAAAISWPQVVEGWVTTAGINTTKALDQDVVVAAYPNADLYYDSVGRLYYLRDPELGISVAWNFLYFYTASMTIFEPYTPPPPPDLIRVESIEMSYTRHSVTANVTVLDEQDKPVEGATIYAEFTGSTQGPLYPSATTDAEGSATFTIDKAHRGVYRITITNVVKEGYKFDYDGSILVGVVTKPK